MAQWLERFQASCAKVEARQRSIPTIRYDDALPIAAKRDEIKAALQELPEDFRMAVYYADVEGLPYKEIAEIMDTPIGTVMSRLNRGRTQLRGLLTDHARERGLIGAQA